jgi:hypothetical protein
MSEVNEEKRLNRDETRFHEEGCPHTRGYEDEKNQDDLGPFQELFTRAFVNKIDGAISV